MQFTIVQAITLFAASAIAMPSNAQAGSVEARSIEARADCSRILPACNGGRVVGQTNCRCPGQKETCDLWSCPGSGENTVMVCGQAGTGCVWI
ncbi:hypothetical protein jhhlp_001729 [Lomentospora prolificans]|uniref:Signal peptide-containing protein n=1 Tax=Lomentospora prolificans TaxID=41688 RepID=A0A2N3NH71_9PEZI|nr:hypothetical protein jhhlp_001729 [Lomentospora prolificans]